MKIGIDIRSLMDRQYSGVNMYAFNLLDALFNIDKENEYVLFYNCFKELDVEARTNFKADNIKYHRCRIPNRILNTSVTFFNRPRIDKMLGNPTPTLPHSAVAQGKLLKGMENLDIFFSPNFLFSALSKDCKKIVTAHDLSFERCPRFYGLKGRLWHKFVRTRKMCMEADLIIAVSENTKYDIMELYGINEDKIKVVYPGVESPPFFEEGERGKFFEGMSVSESMANSVAKTLPPPHPQRGESAKYILFLGTVEKRKNVLGVVEAFKILNEAYGICDYDLVIAGGKGYGYKTIELEIRNYESGIRNKIKLIGYINENDKADLYRNASLFVYPSFYEGFGFPPLEAMAAGIPVIVSHTSSLPEVAADAALAVDPYNIEDIVLAMKQLLTDDKLCSLMKERGYGQVKKFNWEKSAYGILEIFESIV